jgi:hypothetical protein
MATQEAQPIRHPSTPNLAALAPPPPEIRTPIRRQCACHHFAVAAGAEFTQLSGRQKLTLAVFELTPPGSDTW